MTKGQKPQKKLDKADVVSLEQTSPEYVDKVLKIEKIPFNPNRPRTQRPKVQEE